MIVSNVAMLTADYWPNIGGIAAHVGHLSRALVRLGVRVTIYNFTEREDLPREEEVGGLRVLRFTQRHLLKPWRRWGEAYRLARRVNGVFLADMPELLHFHTSTEGPILRWCPRCGGRLFTNHASQYLDLWEKPTGRAKLRLLLPSCDAVIAPSRELAEKSSLLKVPPTEIHYIPNGVDIDVFNGSDGQKVRARLGIQSGEAVVLCARRFVPKNGLVYFAQAVDRIVREMPEVRILFVGDGDAHYRDEVIACLGSRGRERAIFTGSVPNDEMPGYYASADISVIPSLREATSLTCLESMASCLPVVVTDVGGLPELVVDGREGVIVPAADAPALGSAILALLRDESLGIEMGRAGRCKVVAHYSWDRVAELTAAVYERILAKSC